MRSWHLVVAQLHVLKTECWR
eukprot:SAG11_NODE_11246_length_774_cov_0.918519_1_plen_20_part_10